MHISVLKEEVLDLLQLEEGDKVVDATLGLGGHSKAILQKIGKKGHLYAFEQDERNLKEAKENLRDYEKQITYFHSNFASLKTCLSGEKRLRPSVASIDEDEAACVPLVDAILFDLGISSPHVDDVSRGFSFREDGPLDMRFDQRQDLTAEKVINKWPEQDLVEIFSRYGEEKASKLVARRIVEQRKQKPFETTTELADFIRDIKKKFPGKKDHATQVFQALRMAVNDEVAVLEEVLPDAIEALKPGGRLAVISFHSIEDRITKNVFRDYSKDLEDPDEPLINKVIREKQVEIITKKPMTPSEEEITANPRARSAKLRVIGKL